MSSANGQSVSGNVRPEPTPAPPRKRIIPVVEDVFARSSASGRLAKTVGHAASRASSMHATGLLTLTPTEGGADVGAALVQSFCDDTENYIGDNEKLRDLRERVSRNKLRITEEWWRLQAELQQGLIEHLIELGDTSAAAWGTDLGDAVYTDFRRLHLPFCRSYFATCQSSLAAWRAKTDDQRYMINFGAQGRLLNRMGQLGTPYAAEHYVNAVLTSDTRRMTTLQAQGPKSHEQAQRLADAAQSYAASQGMQRLAFVNLAGGQIPNFADALPSGALYVEFSDWVDGTLLEEHQPLLTWLSELWEWVGMSLDKPLVVFNCNAGLDRSGIANLLTQLVVDHSNSPMEPMERLDAVLAQIKAGRPRAISTLRRYRFARDLYSTLQTP